MKRFFETFSFAYACFHLCGTPFAVAIEQTQRRQCMDYYRALARAHGNSPEQIARESQPYERRTEVYRTGNQYVVNVFDLSGNVVEQVRFSPADPENLEAGYTVVRTFADGSPAETTHSDRPPVAAKFIAEENRRRLAHRSALNEPINPRSKEEIVAESIKKNRRLHGISEIDIKHSLAIVSERNPTLQGMDLDFLVLAHATSVNATARHFFKKGVKFRGHSLEQVKRFLSGLDYDDSTIENEDHQRYQDILTSVVSLRKHSMSDIADAVQVDLISSAFPLGD
jgi:hypothetical protein